MALLAPRFVLTVFLLTLDLSDGAVLTTVSSCICPGYEAMFRCTVDDHDGVTTVWRGSALGHCPGDGSIILRHSQFHEGHTINKTCGASGHQVVGQAISAENGSYTSQLTISISQQIIGSVIECTADGRYGSSSLISMSTGTVIQYPRNIQVSHINRHQLILSWTPVYENCLAMHYSVNATHCGECPSITHSNSVICNITSLILPQVCTVVIQAVVCNHAHGPTSEMLSVALQVPDTPSFSVIPEYSGETNYLNKLFVKINSTNKLKTVVKSIITSYIINVTDTISGISCGSAIIPTSYCRGDVCTYTFNTTSSSECPPSTDISVTVFATNALGNGPSSNVTLINGINNFVDIDLDFSITHTAKCTFLKQNRSHMKSCRIDYGPKQMAQCSSNLPLSSAGNATVSDTVHIHLQPSSHSDFVHCYHLKASDGIHTVSVVGMFIECNPDQLSNSVSIPDHDVMLYGSSHSALRLENGIVLFSGIKVGSIAFYYCNDCDYKTLLKSAESSCGRNGQWNGTIPTCDCSSTSQADKYIYSIITSNPGLWFGVFGGLVAMIILTITVCFAITTIILIRAKAKLKAKLDSQCGNSVYEEIGQVSQSNMDTADNVAYVSCRTYMHTSTYNT